MVKTEIADADGGQTALPKSNTLCIKYKSLYAKTGYNVLKIIQMSEAIWKDKFPELMIPL
jgi:hypothetical protein